MSDYHDVIVVGAGPGGSSAAYFLARQGFDVLLVDKAEFPREKTCGDALSPRALAMLQKIGLLPEIRQRGRCIRDIRFFSPNSKVSIKAQVPAHAVLPDYALVFPRLVLDDLLVRRAIEVGAEFIGGLDARDIRRDGKLLEVFGRRSGSEQRFRARLVVVATGASASLLRAIGILKRAPSFMLAARTYYEDVKGIDSHVEFHFDGVPLPGYGWVFPISETCVNIGAGYLAPARRRGSKPYSVSEVFHRFLELPHLREALDGARQLGPIKGYPLRADFIESPTFGDGILLVGEACGLVNPISGEGVDYALESGEMAAEYAAEVLPQGDTSPSMLKGYDDRLRRRFQRQFALTARVRSVYMRPWFLNRCLGLAVQRPEMNDMLVDIALGNRDAADGTSPMTLMKILLNV